MNGAIPSRSFLDPGKMPFDLQEKIGKEIEPYSIIPLLDGEPSGSGTLVMIDSVRGILTAGHVVRNWHDSKPAHQHPKRLGIVPNRSAATLVEEPLEYFDSFVIEPGDSEAFGPDLAFVRIPSPSGFLSTLLTKKSFFDLSGPALRNRTMLVTRKTPIASCGIIAEKTERIGPKIILNQYVIFWTEPQNFERAGFDYIDLRSRRSLGPETPSSFGGLSGSGLWQFSLARLCESEIKPIDFQLVGVAFYQLPDTDDGVATVRFHGPRSTYEQFLPRVRDWSGTNGS
jgi:hypothetical protein